MRLDIHQFFRAISLNSTRQHGQEWPQGLRCRCTAPYGMWVSQFTIRIGSQSAASAYAPPPPYDQPDRKISVFFLRVALGKLSKSTWRIFSVKGVSPPLSHPLNGNSFCQKSLSGKGGYTPPLNGKSPKIFLKKWVKKG